MENSGNDSANAAASMTENEEEITTEEDENAHAELPINMGTAPQCESTMHAFDQSTSIEFEEDDADDNPRAELQCNIREPPKQKRTPVDSTTAGNET